MSINIGTSEVINIYIGDTPATAVYIGDMQIWGGGGKDYSKEYFTIEILENKAVGNNGIKWAAPNTEYSLNDGEWTSWDTTIFYTFEEGDKIRFRSNNYVGQSGIIAQQRYNAYGNVMSLQYGDNFIGQTAFPSTANTFCYLFQNSNGNSTLVNAENLILPATTLTNNCYKSMFFGCSYLITAPELPATTLASSCYENMFSNCTSLTTAPELPATTLTYSCYSGMFGHCTSLTEAPELPATTLANYCYKNMFNGCTSLTTASNIIISATNQYLASCNQMFAGCTSLTQAPTILSTALAQSCYRGMFSGCTSLTTAPELPAESVSKFAYTNMFEGCSNLSYIKCLSKSYSSTIFADWVKGVSATGTFVKDANMTSWGTGTSGIPDNWTIIDA